jgi:hypothetical protein
VNVCGKQGEKRNPCQVFFGGYRYFSDPRLLNKINVLGYLGTLAKQREQNVNIVSKKRATILVAQLFGLGGKITA